MKYIADGLGSEGAVAIYEYYGQLVKVPVELEEGERLDKAYELLGLTKADEEQRLDRLEQLRRQVDELAKPSDDVNIVLSLILAEIKHLRQAEEMRARRIALM